MARVLVVEDSSKWQMLHQAHLESVLGKGNVDIVDNYNDAISMLGRSYVAYILDVQFPRYHGGEPQLVGVQLAQEIGRRENGYDKIAMASSGGDMLVKARELGVTKLYNKGTPNKKNGEKCADDLVQDLQYLFNAYDI